MTSGNGSYDIFGGSAAVFGTGWGETIGADGAIFRAKGGRMDNAITYMSPELPVLQFMPKPLSVRTVVIQSRKVPAMWIATMPSVLRVTRAL